MNKLSLILFLVLAVISKPISAEADDPENWRSLENVIEALSTDKNKLAYLATRCGSLFLSLSKAFSSRADSKEISDSMLNKGSDFLVISASVNLQIGGEEKTRENIEKQMASEEGIVVEMSNAYIDRMLNNYKTQGGFFEEDRFMKSEIKTCSQTYEALHQ